MADIFSPDPNSLNSPVQQSKSEQQTGARPFGRANTDTARWVAQGEAAMSERSSYLVQDGIVTTKDENGNVTIVGMVPFETGQKIEKVQDYLTVAKDLHSYYFKNGKTNELATLLGKKYNVKNFSANDKTYWKLLQEAVSDLTIKNYTATIDAPLGSQGKTQSLLDFLKEPGIGGGAGTPSKNITITGKQQAWDIFRRTAESLTGNTPNRKDFNDYYAKLVAQQKKYVSTRGDVVDVTNVFDVNSFTLEYIVGKTKISGDMKKVFGQYQNTVGRLIDGAGLSGKISAASQADMIKKLVLGKYTEDDINDTVRNQAMIAYSAFADDIKNNKGLTVQQILEPFVTQYQNTLEISGQPDIADVVKKATGPDGKKLSSWDFEKSLRNDSRFAYTKQANAEAANLAQSFARAFGVNV